MEFLGINLSEAHKRLIVKRNEVFFLETSSLVAKEWKHRMASKADIGVRGSCLVKPYYIYLDGLKNC